MPETRLRRAVVTHRIAAFTRSSGIDSLAAALALHGDAVAPIDRLGAKLAIGAALPASEAVTHLRNLCEEAAAAGQSAVATSAQVLYADALRRAQVERTAS